MKLARVLHQGSPIMVVRGERDAVAAVDGQTFADLPQLLAAAGGERSRIRPDRWITVADADLLSPVARPRKIVCIGLNYRQHAEETGAQLPEHPIIFPKWDNAIAGPFEEIPLPTVSQRVDWEAELTFVFGKTCRHVAAADAGSVIFGFTCANDVSVRDYQNHTSQWGAGKCWDKAAPLGPVIVSCDELDGVSPNLAIRGILNGEQKQDSRTNDLIFSVPELVEYITSIMTMEPGDIVLTGTPSGVGIGQRPQQFLKPGDVFEVAIEGIGSIRNRFVEG
ncbi:MAG: fumarylacetoacetate hydrolase family protein [Dehalococcoidia bacterium]